MSQPLRVGILGCARIVKRAIVAGAQRSGVTVLHSIASSDPARAAQWSQDLGIKAHRNYADLLADSEVDAVYIPLTNEQHLPWVSAAAAAGKHVLCEKPLALNVAQAEEMAAGCRSAGIVLMEAFMWRHHPRATAAAAHLRRGRIGELRLVKMDFSFPIDRTDWRLDAARGGGALFDLGCYGINMARFFTGNEPVEVLCRSRWERFCSDPLGVDMASGFVLRFPGEVLAVCDCSFDAPYRNRIEVVGTTGTLELPGGVLPEDPGPLVVRAGETTTVEGYPGDQYAEELRAFAASIAAGRLLTPAEDGVANMRVLMQLLESARNAAGR